MKTRAQARQERVFAGLGVSPGIAIGPAHLSETGAPTVPEYTIRKSRLDAEKARFRVAVERSRRQLRRLKTRALDTHGAAGEDLAALIDAYLRMLTGSRLVRGIEERIVETRVNAEAAVRTEISKIARGFAELPDRYMAARADDIRESGARLIRNLMKAPVPAFSTLPRGSIILAEDFSPADTALLDPAIISGFATVLGGPEGHTAIMARSLGIPAVLGATGLGATRAGPGIREAPTVIVDGIAGRVIVDPTDATLRDYEARRSAFRRETRRFARLRDVAAVTRDETAIQLCANYELPHELDLANRHGAAGIGLLRTEFLFMNRDRPPGEDEQYESLRRIVEGMAGRPVTIRTLDIGGDKLTYSVGLLLPKSPNPALGLRAIRLSLKQPKLLADQIGAILRAGAHGPVRILLPMVSMVAEVEQVRAVVSAVARRLKRRRVAIADPLPPLGVMIEIPGAALIADMLARVSDFFAIGTNDLTMYSLAIDRADEQVAYLYNASHPAVLRLIQATVDAGLRARIPVSVCGEMAGDPRYTALLLGLGVRELSMAAPSLPRVKQRVRALDLTAATMRAQAIMEQADPDGIDKLIDDFNALLA
jgi:phosphotransferase system enzyme I (PtsI)